MSIESRIDELYKLPLPEFTAARNALAKTLAGDEAKRVKALEKPTVVPWAINQLFWQARSSYDRVMKTGEALRTAQIAALKGRAGDVRQASEAHRKAVGEAVQQATTLAAPHGSHPAADQLARMLEAMSLTAARPSNAGRLTELVQPSGFEALAGVTPAGAQHPFPAAVKKAATEDQPAPATPREKKEQREAERRREQEAAARRKAAEADLKAAQRVREEAAAVASRAEREVDRVKRALDAAQRTLDQAQRDLLSAEQKVTFAKAALR